MPDWYQDSSKSRRGPAGFLREPAGGEQNPAGGGGMVFDGIPADLLYTNRPHPARIYDYFLGGRDNYEVDRFAAEEIVLALPQIHEAARANRKFLHRVIRTVVGAGVRQIIDIGTGIPTSPNTHEVAQAVAPETRVAYIDNDPVVQAHADARLTGARDTVFARADFREPRSILEHPEVASVIDFSEPVAVILIAILHFITEPEEPARCIRALRDAVAPGSYLALSHATDDGLMDEGQAVVKVFSQATTPLTLRRRSQVLEFFDGFELLDPGLVSVARWRPDPAEGEPPHFRIYAGAGIKQ
jgi:hypothetical protein